MATFSTLLQFAAGEQVVIKYSIFVSVDTTHLVKCLLHQRKRRRGRVKKKGEGGEGGRRVEKKWGEGKGTTEASLGRKVTL